MAALVACAAGILCPERLDGVAAFDANGHFASAARLVAVL